MYDIEKELALYKLREIENEDMRLKIEELEIGEQLASTGFGEHVQTSMKCKNNDYVLNQKETLERKIKINQIANKRVDNALKVLTYDGDLEVVKKIFIEKKSIARTSQELFRSRKSVTKSMNKALEKLRGNSKGSIKGTEKVQ